MYMNYFSYNLVLRIIRKMEGNEEDPYKIEYFMNPGVETNITRRNLRSCDTLFDVFSLIIHYSKDYDDFGIDDMLSPEANGDCTFVILCNIEAVEDKFVIINGKKYPKIDVEKCIPDKDAKEIHSKINTCLSLLDQSKQFEYETEWKKTIYLRNLLIRLWDW